jgi:hypothetical protein
MSYEEVSLQTNNLEGLIPIVAGAGGEHKRDLQMRPTLEAEEIYSYRSSRVLVVNKVFGYFYVCFFTSCHLSRIFPHHVTSPAHPVAPASLVPPDAHARAHTHTHTHH